MHCCLNRYEARESGVGAGKSTLVQNILTEKHGLRVAVILNEVGSEKGIEKAMLQDEAGEVAKVNEWVELTNGCLCCSVKDDFVNALESLMLQQVLSSGSCLGDSDCMSVWKPLHRPWVRLVRPRCSTVFYSTVQIFRGSCIAAGCSIILRVFQCQADWTGPDNHKLSQVAPFTLTKFTGFALNGLAGTM